MKMSTKIKLQQYGCEIIFVITDKTSLLSKNICKKHEIKFEDYGEVEGLVISANLNLYYLIIDQAYLTHNTIAHEVFHIAVQVTEDRAIYEEESQAWVAGYVSEKIYKFLSSKKISVNG
jgi:hypothetical protein